MPSLAFLRIIAVILGLLTGLWLLTTFSAFVSETWTGGDVGILLIPIFILLFGVAYIIVLSFVIFKSVITTNAFIKRIAVFISTCLVMSIVLLTFAGKLYWIPILRITNAPLSIFDRFTLEKQLGFKPLIPTKPFPGLEPSWLSVSQGNFELNFKQGGGTFSVSQSNEKSTSSVMKWCSEMQQDSEHFASTPLVVAQQETFLYYPKSIEPDVWSSYCVPLNDRVIFISPGYGGTVGSIETLQFWLENLE